MTTGEGLAGHWDDAYRHGDGTRSWYQAEPRLSLDMLDRAGVAAHDAVIDVGGGASTLVDALLRRGFLDVTVLDLSAVGMSIAQERLGQDAHRVHWSVADVLTWQPQRRYQIWHDRAVFHFLTTREAQQRYVQTLDRATTPQAVAVFGCFAPQGPQQCSGLPTARYDAPQLADALGPDWMPISDMREEHVTPTGFVQPLTWAAFRREA